MTELFGYIEFIENIFNRPFGVLLIIAGLFFLLIAILFQLTQIQNRIANMMAIVLGTIFIIIGMIFHFNPPKFPISTPVDKSSQVANKSKEETPLPQPNSEEISTPHQTTPDKAIQKAYLCYAPVTQFEFIWNTSENERKEKAYFYRPLPPAGYKLLGHYARHDQKKPTEQVLVVKVASDVEDEGILAYPVRYESIWNDTEAYGAIWRPVPPPGYRCLGDVATIGYSEPDRKEIVCVKNFLVTEGKPGTLIWNTHGDNAMNSLRVYSILAKDTETGIACNLFQGYGRNWFRKTGHFSPPVLNYEYITALKELRVCVILEGNKP